MKISAPILAESLPLYATDPELRAAIFGARAKEPLCGNAFAQFAKRPDFPRLHPVFGGRHVPSVLAWFERYESGIAQGVGPTEEERAERWRAGLRQRGAAKKKQA